MPETIGFGIMGLTKRTRINFFLTCMIVFITVPFTVGFGIALIASFIAGFHWTWSFAAGIIATTIVVARDLVVNK